MGTERPDYIVVGLSHHTAPVALRERFAVSPARLRSALASICVRPGVREAVLLSTCNRVEWYLAAQDRTVAVAAATAFFGTEPDAPDPAGRSAIRALWGEDAVRHVFRVAGGLDSMIVGERQILGQVRAAFAAGRAAGSVGPHLDALLRDALSAGRRARRETGLGRSAASVPAAAVAHATRLLGALGGRRVLIVGAGKMGAATVRAMVRAGAGHVIVTNRTPETARSLAAVFGGDVTPFDRLGDELRRADIVIVSTDAPRVILDAATIAAAAGVRCAPLVIVDIAVPRNVDPLAGRLPGVHLCDVDDLVGYGAEAAGGGQDVIRRAEALVETEVALFLRARAARSAAPVIAAARADAQAIVESEWGRARARLSTLTADEEAAVRTVLRRVVNKLLHRPITTLAAAAGPGPLEPAAPAGPEGDRGPER